MKQVLQGMCLFYSVFNSEMAISLFLDVVEGVFEPGQQLGQMQQELQLASQFSGYELSQPIFVTAAAAQVFTIFY